MDVPPKRRRFRFGLRAMFVAFTVVAAFAAWLAWNVRVVEQRKAALKGLVGGPQAGGMALPRDGWVKGPDIRGMITFAPDGSAPAPYTRYEPTALSSTSTLRRWLGDYDRWLIACRPDADVRLIRERFPEALLLVPLTHEK